MVCTLSFGEISNIHDGLHIRLASALLTTDDINIGILDSALGICYPVSYDLQWSMVTNCAHTYISVVDVQYVYFIIFFNSLDLSPIPDKITIIISTIDV